MAALQAVTGWSRTKALKVAKADAKYREGTGVPRGGLEAALAKHGFQFQRMPRNERDSVATFALRNDWGTFLVYTAAHVMALVDGELFNSRGNWGKPVEDATQVLSAS